MSEPIVIDDKPKIKTQDKVTVQRLSVRPRGDGDKWLVRDKETGTQYFLVSKIMPKFISHVSHSELKPVK